MDDIARGSAPGSFLELSAGTTHFEWHGASNGPTAVCIHGLTTPSFVWGGMLGGLTDMGFRVLTYDLYGRGYSDRPGGVQDQEFFIRQLSELLDREGVGDDITLIGHSMGGAIATAFAAQNPSRIRQLVLLAPAGMTRINGRLIRFIIGTPVVGDWLMLALFPRNFSAGVAKERHLPSSVKGIYDLQVGQLGYKGFVGSVLGALRGMLSKTQKAEHIKLSEFGLPVLAIWGREDDVVPLASVGTLTEWSRNARHEVIDGAGHGLLYTHSDETLSLMSKHIRGDG